MSPLASAPFLVVFAGWCAGLSSSSRFNPLVAALIGAFLSFAFLLVGTRHLPPGWGVFLPTTLLLVAVPIVILVARVQTPPSGERPFEGKAIVVSERSWGFRHALVLKTGEGRLLCLESPEKTYREGMELHVKGKVISLEQLFPNRAGDFDGALYWRGKGVKEGFRPWQIESRERSVAGLASWRTFIRKKLLLNLPPLVRGHLLAAWTGEKDPEVSDLHKRWGTAHLLAVSGFHVGIVAAVLLWCLRGFRFKLLWSSGILWGYVLLTGGAPSAIRAMMMIQLALLGPMVSGRPSSGINSVAVAGGLLLLMNPWLFWDIGWRLSVISALVLCSVVKAKSRMNLLLASFSIWMATAGPVSLVFGSVPVAGIFINVLALPVFSLLLPVASIAALPALSGIPGAWIAPLGMEGVFETWILIANTASELLPWQVPYSPLIGGLSAGMLGGAVGYGLGLGWKKDILLSILAVFCGSLFF